MIEQRYCTPPLKRCSQGKFSVFPLPWASSATIGEKKTKATARTPVIERDGGTLDDPTDLEPWRPNIFMFRPQDYWRGSVDYVPWKLGDDESSSDEYQPPSAPVAHGTALPKDGEKIGVQSGVKPPRTQVGGDRRSVTDKNTSPCRAVAPADKKNVETGRWNHHVDGACVLSGQVGVSGACSCEDRGVERELSHRGDDLGKVSGRNDYCSSTLKAGRGKEVEAALHGVLDALRKVREERLRLATCIARGAPETNRR